MAKGIATGFAEGKGAGFNEGIGEGSRQGHEAGFREGSYKSMKTHMTACGGQYFMTPDKIYPFNNTDEIISTAYTEPRKILTEFLFDREFRTDIDEFEKTRKEVDPGNAFSKMKSGLDELITQHYPDRSAKSFAENLEHFKSIYDLSKPRAQLLLDLPEASSNLRSIHNIQMEIQALFPTLNKLDEELKIQQEYVFDYAKPYKKCVI